MAHETNLLLISNPMFVRIDSLSYITKHWNNVLVPIKKTVCQNGQPKDPVSIRLFTIQTSILKRKLQVLAGNKRING